MQQVRHLAAGKLFFRFGVGVVTISSTCSRKVIAIAHSAVVLTAHVAEVAAAGNLAGVIAILHCAAVVLTAHAADLLAIGIRAGNIAFVMAPFHSAAVGVLTANAADTLICAGNHAGVIASAHRAAYVIAAHAAGVKTVAGNLAVVRTVFQGAFVFAAHTVGARTVASNPAGVMASDHNAAFVIAAHAADIRVSGHIGTRDGDFFYGADCGAIRANAAEQANVARSAINVQPADGMVLTVKGACKRLVFCADGRPRIEAGVGVQAAVVV